MFALEYMIQQCSISYFVSILSDGRGQRGFRHQFSERDRGEHHKHSMPNESYAIKDDEKNLHPSWAAKRKQKINIDDKIQGKKIRFDHQDEDFVTKSSHSNEPKNLHPSWAAKKDFNKGIQPFQGKKKVFNDDD